MKKELLIKMVVGTVLYAILYTGIELFVTREFPDIKLILLASILWGVIMALIEEFFFVKKLPD